MNKQAIIADAIRDTEDAIIYLKRIASFDGHGDLYTWANDPKTAELFEDIRTLLSNLSKEQA